ncbi:MAG: hypothetical protein ACRD29_24515 [Acidimicrobiales bacterium]
MAVVGGVVAAIVYVGSRSPPEEEARLRPRPSEWAAPPDQNWSADERGVPTGPMLDTPTGLHLLVDTNAGFRAVDLDTGIWSGRRHFDYGFTGRGIEAGAIAVVQRDGGVVIAADEEVAFHEAPFDANPVPLLAGGSPGGSPDGTGTNTGTDTRAIRAFASDVVDRIWLVLGRGAQRVAQEVDLSGRTVTPAAPFPADAEPVTGVRGGLAIRGLDGRGYLFDRHGQVNRITDGELVGGGGDLVIERTCDDQLRCGWQGRNLRTGDQIGLDAFAGTARLIVPGNALAPGGDRLAVVAFDGAARWELATIATATGAVDAARAVIPAASFLPIAFWSPTGDRIFCVESHQLYAYRLGDPEVLFISTEIPLPSFSVAVPFTA